MKLINICFNIVRHDSTTYDATPKQHMYLHFPNATDFAFQVRLVWEMDKSFQGTWQ